MNVVTRTPVEANGHGGDDLEEVLIAFFRSEMPHPWPPLKLPDEAPPARLAQPAPPPSRRPWFRSPHFALAVSVALLIGGYAVMSGALTPPVPADATPIDGQTPTATGIKGVAPVDDGVGVDIDSLEQVGNNPTTIHIKAFQKK
jgi:hypothetical protein